MGFKRRQQVGLARILQGYGACPSAIEWAKTRTSAYSAWRNCERYDWLLWIAKRLDVDQEVIACATSAARAYKPATAVVPHAAYTGADFGTASARAAYFAFCVVSRDTSQKALLTKADIVRQHIPWHLIRDALHGGYDGI